VSSRADGQRINKFPTILYNQMLHPLLRYPIKGVIWYQGESNANNDEQAAAYRQQFAQLIRSWRAEWSGTAAEFPFFWVQLPNYGPVDTVPPARAVWATLRESQTAALDLPNTGQVVTIDVGDPRDLHPRDKELVGQRLARVARRVAYGETKLLASGPVYRGHTVRAGHIEIEFDNVGSGLVSRSGENVGGFAIAGADRVWTWADARIDGNRVVVSSSRVPQPVAVRYAWSDSPKVVGLYNREGLPAAPFRTGTPTSAAPAAWVGTWGTAPQLVEPANLPPAPGLAGNTLRQIVRVSVGGNQLRVRFSNAYGATPVTLNSVHIAGSAGGSAIDPATDHALTFSGQRGVTIPPRRATVSDAFAFPLQPLSKVAITIHFGTTSTDITGHPGSRTTSYLQPGEATAAVGLPDAVETVHWYILTGVDVATEDSGAAVVVLGNSITDGRGSGTDLHNRWPDELAIRLHANQPTAKVAVINQGIGGNCVLRDCLGPSALSRFDRDVLGQSAVRWLIILEGVNDIGQAAGAEASAAVARGLIAAYRQMIGKARAQSIKVYGATIMPFGESFYDHPEREAARQTVNEWIRTSGAFDGVIDTDAALRDPERPTHLLPAADTGDHLHPNELGHKLIARAVDLGLFAR
jgi:lysophospholipase L1-like esterase